MSYIELANCIDTYLGNDGLTATRFPCKYQKKTSARSGMYYVTTQRPSTSIVVFDDLY